MIRNDIPEATPQHSLHIPENAIRSIICIDTIAYRATTDTRAVRKNGSLPAWVAALADKRGVNCSQVLQDGLTKLLGASAHSAQSFAYARIPADKEIQIGNMDKLHH